MSDHLTGGAAVVDALRTHGVQDIFGIPGTHNLEIYRYLPDSGIRHIVTRHEQGAGYAADGYARVSGRPGVVLTTSGPGITNAITALATAYADSVPVLAVSPGMPRGTVGRDVGWLHEVKNQQAALDAVTARSVRVEHPDAIAGTVADIFDGFTTRRPRPVHLEIPVDVLEGDWRRSSFLPHAQSAPVRPTHDRIAEIAAALVRAQRPVIVAGGGSRSAYGSLTVLADRGIPVLTTVNGKGVIDESHPSALGASARLQAAHAAMNDADVLLVIGSELGDSDLWGGQVDSGRDGERIVVRVDVDPGQVHKNVRADLPVVGDAAAVLNDLLAVLPSSQTWDRSGVEALRDDLTAEAAIDGTPWEAVQSALSRALPADTIVAGDSSQVTYYGTVHSWRFTPANRLLYPTGYATLGYGLPAAIGAKIAQPDRAVVALVGDGAAMFSLQELITATEQGLPIPIVIADNGGYGEIRQQMVDRGITPQAVDLYRPDIPAVAHAIGAHGLTARDADEAGTLAAQALSADRPTVIHLPI